MNMLQQLTQPINLIINIFGIVMLVLLTANAAGLTSHKRRITDAMEGRRIRSTIKRGTLEVEDDELPDTVTPDTIRFYETDFNRDYSKYNVYAQLIPIFPLLGILGTVWGLVRQLVSGDIELMLASLNIALWSTLFGLIWAILLKFLAVICNARLVSDVEILLSDYEKKLTNAVRFNNIKDE
ncbi:MAG: MotA/TolQ/ExbB proton channel family protein [Lachnospiraceae bacterium]|nr:MotA/TolQ/ExbB proton channel family protein [Lachnospiraceae bacterium]